MNKQQPWFRTLTIVQFALIHVFIALAVINDLIFFPTSNPLHWVIDIGLLLVIRIVFLTVRQLDRLLIPTVLAMALFGLTTSLRFYPELLEYRATNKVGKWAVAHEVPDSSLYFMGLYGHGMDFYGERITPSANVYEVADRAVGEYLFVMENVRMKLDSMYAPFYEVEEEWPDYPVPQVNSGFLIPATRDGHVKMTYLLRITDSPTSVEQPLP